MVRWAPSTPRAHSNDGIVQTSASIIATEARHAAYLSWTLSLPPFPVAFEPSMAPENVTSQPLVFVEECPFDSLPLPLPRSSVRDCSNSSSPIVPTTGGATSTPTSSNTNNTAAPSSPQSGATAPTASTAIAVTLIAMAVAAAIHAVGV